MHSQHYADWEGAETVPLSSGTPECLPWSGLLWGRMGMWVFPQELYHFSYVGTALNLWVQLFCFMYPANPCAWNVSPGSGSSSTLFAPRFYGFGFLGCVRSFLFSLTVCSRLLIRKESMFPWAKFQCCSECILPTFHSRKEWGFFFLASWTLELVWIICTSRVVPYSRLWIIVTISWVFYGSSVRSMQLRITSREPGRLSHKPVHWEVVFALVPCIACCSVVLSDCEGKGDSFAVFLSFVVHHGVTRTWVLTGVHHHPSERAWTWRPNLPTFTMTVSTDKAARVWVRRKEAGFCLLRKVEQLPQWEVAMSEERIMQAPVQPPLGFSPYTFHWTPLLCVAVTSSRYDKDAQRWKTKK